jgi:beta-phosphoglucomutase-like phosphatase (HAD superfamily)
MAFKGILFDFDGTLAQTMEDHFLAWRAALSEFGISFDASDYYPLEGMRVHEIAATLMAGKATELPSVEEVARLKESFYLKNSMFKLYPGVDELTRELARRSIPMAVVTAGRAYRIEKSTPAEFLARFQAIVSGESTTHGKPHPEPFLLGSQKLGLNPCRKGRR